MVPASKGGPSKHLQSFIQPLLSKEVWVERQTRTIPVDRRRLVSIVIVSEYDAKLDSNYIKSADLQFDEGLIGSQFKSGILLGPGGQSP